MSAQTAVLLERRRGVAEIRRPKTVFPERRTGPVRPRQPRRGVYADDSMLERRSSDAILEPEAAPKEAWSAVMRRTGRVLLKALIFVLIWTVFPFWFFLWLALNVVRLKVLSAWWEGPMKDALATMYSL